MLGAKKEHNFDHLPLRSLHPPKKAGNSLRRPETLAHLWDEDRSKGVEVLFLVVEPSKTIFLI